MDLISGMIHLLVIYTVTPFVVAFNWEVLRHINKNVKMSDSIIMVQYSVCIRKYLCQSRLALYGFRVCTGMIFDMYNCVFCIFFMRINII